LIELYFFVSYLGNQERKPVRNQKFAGLPLTYVGIRGLYSGVGLPGSVKFFFVIFLKRFFFCLFVDIGNSFELLIL